MRAYRYATLVAASAAAAIVVSACGGSSEETEASATLKPIVAMGSTSGGMNMKMGAERSASGMEMAPTSAHGVADLTQSGDRLTGTVRVWGLEPGSRHAEHLHGPDGACAPSSKMTPNMAVVLPDLEANAKGTAVAKIDLTVHQEVLGSGYFIMVHEKPTPPSERDQIGSAPASPAFMQALSGDPGILCGNVRAKS